MEDVNDSAPRMERAVVACAVSGEAARGTALARVGAWDPDERDAARLHYALEGAEQRAFSVHARTGVLALADTRAWLAAAPGALRSLNVSVSDGAHAAFARVKLALAPANRAPPRFPHLVHEARARENQPPPLLLTTVRTPGFPHTLERLLYCVLLEICLIIFKHPTPQFLQSLSNSGFIYICLVSFFL